MLPAAEHADRRSGELVFGAEAVGDDIGIRAERIERAEAGVAAEGEVVSDEVRRAEIERRQLRIGVIAFRIGERAVERRAGEIGLAFEADGRVGEARDALRRALATGTLNSELAAVAEQHLRQ